MGEVALEGKILDGINVYVYGHLIKKYPKIFNPFGLICIM